MATVDKNFRVKNGLVVEGTTGTINGNNIVTDADTTDIISEGTTNLYFTDGRVQDVIVNAVQENISITATDGLLYITAENGVGDSTTDDLDEGTVNLYFTDARAQAAVAGDISTAIDALDTDDIEEGSTKLYFTNQRALNATSSAYDAAGSAASAQSAAESYADDLVGDATVDGTAGNTVADRIATAESNANDYTDDRETAITTAYQSYADTAEADAISTAASDATSKANTAESNANSYTDDLIGDVTVDGTSGNTVTDRIASAVSNLVDSAPGALDTLNELAAALGDDANFSTTVTNSIAEKVAKSGDTMTGFLTLHADPTNALHAVTKQYVDAAVTSGVGGIDTDAVPEGDSNLYYTTERAQEDAASLLTGATLTNITITGDGDGLTITAENGVADSDTDDLTEGSSNLYFTDQRAVDALEAVVPNFTEVDINSVATQVAATVNLADTNQTAAYSFDSGSYRSAKFLVKAAYGVHTEVSEILVTLDTSDNIAITEYAIVSTNGSLIDVTAGMNGTDVEILATAGTANTDVTVVGTLVA